MTITIRLDPKLSRQLAQAADTQGETKSELVRRWLRECLERQRNSATAWELGKEVFGRHASGRSDLSVRGKAILGERLRARKKRRG